MIKVQTPTPKNQTLSPKTQNANPKPQNPKPQTPNPTKQTSWSKPTPLNSEWTLYHSASRSFFAGRQAELNNMPYTLIPDPLKHYHQTPSQR